jgi:hypothetical protein
MSTINSGLSMRIVPRSNYSFTALTATTGAAAVQLAQHIDVSVFTEADLMVRYHTGTTVPTGATLLVGAVSDGYDFEDPANYFLPPGTLTSASPGTIQITSSTTYPFYGVTSLGLGGSTSAATPMGRLISIALFVTQGSTSGNIIALLSVDLILKGGDPRSLPAMPNGYMGYRLL